MGKIKKRLFETHEHMDSAVQRMNLLYHAQTTKTTGELHQNALGEHAFSLRILFETLGKQTEVLPAKGESQHVWVHMYACIGGRK